MSSDGSATSIPDTIDCGSRCWNCGQTTLVRGYTYSTVSARYRCDKCECGWTVRHPNDEKLRLSALNARDAEHRARYQVEFVDFSNPDESHYI